MDRGYGPASSCYLEDRTLHLQDIVFSSRSYMYDIFCLRLLNTIRSRFIEASFNNFRLSFSRL